MRSPLVAALAGSILVATATLAATDPPAQSASALRLDGDRSDWSAIAEAVTDPRGDGDVPSDAPEVLRELDLGGIRVAETPDALWLLLEIATRPVNVQSLPEPASIEIAIDADASDKTGEERGALTGADLVLRYCPRSGTPRTGRGASVQLIERDAAVGGGRDRTPVPQAVGVNMAPSTASTWLELRLDRLAPDAPSDARGIRFGKKVRIAVRVLGADGAIFDETPVVEYAFSGNADSPVRIAHALAADTESTLRVMSWNVERGSMFKTPEAFAEVFRALAPDVLLLQELDGTATPERLKGWLDERIPVEGGWKVAVSGGDLRVAVAARKLLPASELASVQRPQPNGARPVRVVGGIVELGSRRVLVASVHLKCCGSIGSREDLTREAEVVAIRTAVREALEEAARNRRPIDGVVIAGDFNLVGGGQVLTAAAEGIDLDSSPLEIAPLFGPDGLANLTWRDMGSEFMPGRLDYLLFSDSRLDLVDGMVIDPAVLVPGHAIEQPSDHLPIVADLRWKAVAGRRP